jgi:glycine dehydrogenase
MSFPVAGTLMVEPTESESLEELDRFCDAMIAIREEITAVQEGRLDARDNPLANAPHTLADVAASQWDHPYSRELAAYPVDSLRRYKYWAPVNRVDNVYGDRHLFCACPAVESYRVEEVS